MAKKFNLDAAKENLSTSSGNELSNIENQQEYDFQFVKLKEITCNPKNDYPIEKIEELKESIKIYGIQHNIVIAPIEENADGKKYEIISGEQRYRAIKSLQEEGYNIYKNGIPCKIESKDTDEVDREIMLIEANELTRTDDPVRTRKMAQRLEELYKKKNMKKGDITKQIANTLNIGERQAQRYRNANNNLIPELINALDTAKISLEMASSIATLPGDVQLNIASMLNNSQKISKEEIELVKKEMKENDKKKQEEIKILEEKAKIEQDKSIQLEKELSENKHKLSKLEKELSENKEIKKDTATDQLQSQIDELQKKVQDITKEKDASEKENLTLQKKIDELSKRKNNVSSEDMKKLKKENELNILAEEINNKIQLLSDKILAYNNEYKTTVTIANFIKKELCH